MPIDAFSYHIVYAFLLLFTKMTCYLNESILRWLQKELNGLPVGRSSVHRHRILSQCCSCQDCGIQRIIAIQILLRCTLGGNFAWHESNWVAFYALVFFKCTEMHFLVLLFSALSALFAYDGPGQCLYCIVCLSLVTGQCLIRIA